MGPRDLQTIVALSWCLGVGALASAETPWAVHTGRAIPRVILALYDGRYDQDTRFVPIHQIAEMPLNHLGLVVTYHDINRPLPPVAQLDDVRGVITWFRSDSMADPHGFLRWAESMVDAGKRFLVVGDLSAAYDLRKNPTPEAELNRFWSRLGLRMDGQWTTITYDWKIASSDPALVGFERSLAGVLPAFPEVRKIDPAVTSHLVVRKHDDPSTDVDLLAVGPHGAYVASGYVHFSQNEESPRRQWYVNPFELFRAAFDTDDLPKPDVTTMSGRRIFYSHVDGDGWRNLTEVPAHKKRHATAASVILEDIVKPFSDLPVTVGPVAGDLDPAWHGNEESRNVARDLLSQPNVEAGSHTYGHPLDWRLSEDEGAIGPKGRFVVAEWLARWFGSETRRPVAGEAAPDAARGQHRSARSYTVRPFSLDLEIREAAAYVSSLLPQGRRVQVVQWSGNTSPSAAAIAATRAAGLRNLNGGDTRFDPEFSSYGWVSPLGRQVGNERQVYASNSNENTYTDRWTDRFFAFKYLAKTIANTESPVRVKPHNIYYHMYSGEKLPSLLAVVENYRYARSQELAPVAASSYAAMVDGFYSARLFKMDESRWRIEARDGLQTIRFDRTGERLVDFSRSRGVIGQRLFQGSLYVALDPAEPSPIVALGGAPGPAPFLAHSRWAVSRFLPCGGGFVFDTQGFGAGESTWHVAADFRFRIRVTSSRGTTQYDQRSSSEGALSLVVPQTTNERVHVSVMPDPS